MKITIVLLVVVQLLSDKYITKKKRKKNHKYFVTVECRWEVVVIGCSLI